jgi:hypothetical protein
VAEVTAEDRRRSCPDGYAAPTTARRPVPVPNAMADGTPGRTGILGPTGTKTLWICVVPLRSSGGVFEVSEVDPILLAKFNALTEQTAEYIRRSFGALTPQATIRVIPPASTVGRCLPVPATRAQASSPMSVAAGKTSTTATCRRPTAPSRLRGLGGGVHHEATRGGRSGPVPITSRG